MALRARKVSGAFEKRSPGCGGLGIFRLVSHEGQVCCICCIESTLDVYRNDFSCVSKRLYMCIETTSICIETTCIETTLYRNDRKPLNLQAFFHECRSFRQAARGSCSTHFKSPKLFKARFLDKFFLRRY